MQRLISLTHSLPLPLIGLILLMLINLTACQTVSSRLPKHDTAEVMGEAEKQREVIVKNYDKEYKRLIRTAYPILRANADLCQKKQDAKDDGRREVAYDFGALVRNEEILRGELHDAAKRVLNLDAFLRIDYVIPATNAAKAGLREGDKISAVNGKPAPYGEDAMYDFGKLVEKETGDDRRITLTVLRQGQKKDIPLQMDKICNYGVVLEINDVENAFADGKNIIFSTKMMRFLNTEKKLALVVGHEIAHNLMDHIEMDKHNANLGMIAGVLFGVATGINAVDWFTYQGATYTGDTTEAEADYVGTYLTYRAGFDVVNAGEIWREMSIDSVASVTHGGTHPPHAERFLAIEKTVSEIQSKKKKGLPILPDMQKETERHDPDPVETGS